MDGLEESGDRPHIVIVAGPPSPARAALESRWLALTRVTLPALAIGRGWPVRADHCFQRILLDNAVGGRWYDHVAGRPAYAHVAADALARAVSLGEGCVEGSTDLAALNRASLAWRRAARAGDARHSPVAVPGLSEG